MFSEDGALQTQGGLWNAGYEPPTATSEPKPEGARINMITAIRRTLDHELSVNPRVLVFGEDVGPKGGVHGVTLGLQEKHGEERVFDTSLSEEGIIGRAVGMAIAGLMPVPEIQFRKYATDTPVNVSLITDVTHGSLTLNSDGTFSYTHDGSENFTDSFVYRLTDNDGQTSDATVSITITPVSDATPVANADSITVAEGGTATSLVGGATNVKANDTGLTDTPVNVSLVNNVAHGSLTLNPDGTFSYTHDGSENLTDSFVYRVTDNDGQTSDATVSITITPVSDTTPVANADSITAAEGGTASSLVGGATNVKTNDTGHTDTPVNVSLVTGVSHGSLTLNADGSFSYTHDGSENFTDSFVYRITDNDGQTSDATVSITITPVSDTTPVANADSITVAEDQSDCPCIRGNP